MRGYRLQEGHPSPPSPLGKPKMDLVAKDVSIYAHQMKYIAILT